MSIKYFAGIYESKDDKSDNTKGYDLLVYLIKCIFRRNNENDKFQDIGSIKLYYQIAIVIF